MCNIYCEKDKSKEINCRTCDITLNKDTDKYVLKSSVPPCPDMSKFATKNMMCPTIDTSKYILKSEIKPCPKIDLSQYIKKSDIPACPDCPTCPKCPICPEMPKQKKCKKIFDYKISEHPEFNKYISKKECHNTTKIINDNDYNKKQHKSLFEEKGNRSPLLNPNKSNTTGYNLGSGMYAKIQNCSPFK